MKKTIILGAVLAAVLTGCKKPSPIYSDTDQENEITLTEEMKSFAPKAQMFNASSDEIIKITTAKNNVIVFPKNAFAYQGKAVTGSVQISITEITTKSEMILSNILTNSDQGPLESQGEFIVKAYQNNKELELTEGAAFTIETGGAYSTDMKGWVYEENPAYTGDGTTLPGQWIAVQNAFNNPCEVYMELMNQLLNVDPINETQKASSLINLVTAMLSLKEDELGIIGGGNYSIDAGSRYYNVNTINTNWSCNDSTQSGLSIYGKGGDFWSTQDTSINVSIAANYGYSFNCAVSVGNSSYNFDPNVIVVSFPELGTCNIDGLISLYGASYNAEIKIEDAPISANVKFVFPSLNGALSAFNKGNGVFALDRLPTGMDIQVVVYYKKDGKIMYGTSTVTASQNMVFDTSNIIELDDLDALKKEIKKLD